MSAENDQLVYCSITAFGESGPRAHQPGMDILGQALGGVMGLTGEVGGEPVKVGVPIADFTVSFLLGFGVCAALRARELNGHGQKISINLLDGQIATLANLLTHYDRTKEPVRPQGGGHPQLAPYQPFRGSDGALFILACLNDRFWKRLTEAISHPELTDDPLFVTNPARVANHAELEARLQEVFQAQPAAYWLEQLDKHGVPCGPINRLEDVFDDPQVVHNESIIRLEHPVHGPYPVPNLPIRFHGTPARPRGYAPRLGEHSREVLESFGFDRAEIDSLVAAAVVTAEEPHAGESRRPRTARRHPRHRDAGTGTTAVLRYGPRRSRGGRHHRQPARRDRHGGRHGAGRLLPPRQARHRDRPEAARRRSGRP